MKAKLLIITALLLSGSLLLAQGGYKGSVTAEVTSEDGSPLPGAVAVLSADTFTRSFVSDANGTVRFVGLTPGKYELKVTFTGFNTYVRPNLQVDTGQNIRLQVPMSPSTQQEEMVVTAETPLMDATNMGTSTVLTEEELNAVPQSRDPWSVIMTVPGIQTDRVNVGGSEAGQQSRFASKGDNGQNASWTMDGIEFVDPAARGATQSYLDFSSFAQMNVTTGGADVAQRSGGAALNFVTKQGSNNHQGSVRLLYADEDFQSSHDAVVRNNGTPFVGNQIAETFEKSFEIGGPLIKDRLWYWGAFSQNSINNILITGAEDRTELRNVSVKLHGDITATTRFNAFYTEGDKIKNGRGGGVSRPPNTTWDQSGPSPIYKFEISQLIGQHTELSFLAARVDGGFALTPQGKDGQIGIDLAPFIWDNTTFIDYSTKRPVRQYELKGNTFLTGNSMDHELSYGFQYKEAEVGSLTTYGSDGMIRWYAGDTSFGVSLYREGNAIAAVDYTSLTLQDTITYGNWTIKAGLRWDTQEGNNLSSSVGANPFNPELLPALDYQGSGTPFSWDTIAPRIGATYTWGDDNQYLVRGSASIFYDTLGTGQITPINPTFVRYSYHYWYDDGDLVVEQGELSDVISQDATRALDIIDPDLEPPETTEFLAGFEWSISPEFTVGITGTIRERSDTRWAPLNANLNPNLHYDLVNATATNPVTGGEVDTSYYVLNDAGAGQFTDQNGDGVVNAEDSNSFRTNRPDYTEDFTSIEVTATKRLSNRWMMRANLSFQDWTRNVGANAIQDPNNFQSGSNEDGGAVGIQSSGSGNRANIYFGSATWSGNINGLYQLPWDVTVSANVNAREGFAFPYAERQRYLDSAGISNTTWVKFDNFDAIRADDLFWADFKLTKTFHMGGRTKVEIAAEVFNAFNEDAVLARELRLDLTTTNEPREVLSPRVGRFSATVHF